MRLATSSPTGVERTFDADEVIVSKTDPRGRITYVNETFVRISRYSEDELMGRPHSIIRHPEMPRAVFDLMWETIAGGEEIFAYVDNLAADGASYWVLAHVTPTRDASGAISGYHSNRRSPDPQTVRRIDPVYRQLRATERAHSGSREGLAASRQMLADLLADRGQTYDEYVWQLIAGEEC